MKSESTGPQVVREAAMFNRKYRGSQVAASGRGGNMFEQKLMGWVSSVAAPLRPCFGPNFIPSPVFNGQFGALATRKSGK